MAKNCEAEAGGASNLLAWAAAVAAAVVAAAVALLCGIAWGVNGGGAARAWHWVAREGGAMFESVRQMRVGELLGSGDVWLTAAVSVVVAAYGWLSALACRHAGRLAWAGACGAGRAVGRVRARRAKARTMARLEELREQMRALGMDGMPHAATANGLPEVVKMAGDARRLYLPPGHDAEVE